MLLTGNNSPGSVFSLNEAGLLTKIESICRDYKYIIFTESAGIRELQFKRSLDKYDVLKFDVRYPTKSGAFLHKINSKLQELPHTNGFPDYHPHSTIAYLKSGSGKKYIEKFLFTFYYVLYFLSNVYYKFLHHSHHLLFTTYFSTK
jgi:hypothetical protein